MSVGELVGNALLLIGVIFGSPTAVHLWRGDEATQRRLQRVSIVRTGGTGDPRWVRSFIPRFVAASIFALTGPVYFALGRGDTGSEGIVVVAILAFCVTIVAASVFLCGRPTSLIPPHMRPADQHDSGAD